MARHIIMSNKELEGNHEKLNYEVENFFIQAQALNFECINHDKYVESLDKKGSWSIGKKNDICDI